ncbi:hypothetical protein [Clostridium perfringens]|nr:hypothetical protein [Clostridium perfringens]MBS5996229.1 hypothetical protein [Clostridium perfringens]MDU2436097.1 hypothetical protein [Clostridium perfringens]MDU2516716.1 hypothetical protein [Clostridium perfringens]
MNNNLDLRIVIEYSNTYIDKVILAKLMCDIIDENNINGGENHEKEIRCA